jgi:rubrerythrin
MSKSEENLREAFAGESQANRKYLAFAKKADKEGYAQVAKLFRAAAAAETVHAHAHLRTLKGVGATADNLKEAIAGETHEFKSMYPEMIEDAKAEDNKAALRSFEYANAVEQVHANSAWLPPIIMSAMSAGTPVKTKPRMNARSAKPKRRPFSKLIRIEDLKKSSSVSCVVFSV